MVGGGSYAWSPKLICDILNEDAMSNSEIYLLDINLKAAEEIKAAGQRLAKDNNKNIKFFATDNEEKAFRSADVVLITISTGGLETMAPDVEIPEKYKIYQSVGDTVGPGGWSRTLRNVPVFAQMARKIEKLSPKAVVLNYSNPMAALTGVFSKVSNLRVLGLCHGPVETKNYLAKIFGVEPGRITARFGGVNHFFWITDFTVDGMDGYKLLRDKLAGRELKIYDKSHKGLFKEDHYVMNELFMTLGYLTYTEDSHTAEFLPGYLHKLSTVKRYHIVRKSMAMRKKWFRETRQQAFNIASGKIPIYRKSIEVAVEVMKAIMLGTSYTDVANLPNTGQIDNLPRGAVVETLGRISPIGFEPITAGPLPPVLQGLVEPHCRIQLMTLEAALTGNRKLAFEALMLDPLCGNLTLAEIRRMGEELLDANKQWLPQF